MKAIPREFGMPLGIVAGFVFLLAFFAGVAGQTVTVVGILFLVVALALVPLMLSEAKKNRPS